MKSTYKNGISTNHTQSDRIDNNLSLSKSSKAKIINSNTRQHKFSTSQNKAGFNNENLSLNLSVDTNMSSENKSKITIRDLCPEEKLKIGELLKRLAQEQEEKENIQKTLEEDKRNLENKINSIMQERENLSTSSFPQNNSINFKLDSFSENCEPHKIEAFSINKTEQNSNNQSEQLNEIKQLKEKFSNLFQTLKKTAKTHEEYLSKLKPSDDSTMEFNENRNNTSHNNNCSDNSYLLKEEKPMVLDCRPTPLSEKIESMNKLGLQTSLLHINDELKGIDESINSLNFMNTEKSLDNISEEKEANNVFGILSSEKMKIIKEKLNLDDHLRRKEQSESSFSTSFSKYKSILNKVREKSKDKYDDLTEMDLQGSTNSKSIISRSDSIRNQILEDKTKNNELKISSGLNIVQYKTNNEFSQSIKTKKIDEGVQLIDIQDEDDKIIAFLNSKDFNKINTNILKKQKESFALNNDDSFSLMESKLELYDEKLYDLIDDIENGINKNITPISKEKE